jgi:hypothetical protein
MSFRMLRSAALGIGLVLAASTASAQFCAGFTDVSSASSFCENVQWVKNREVTTGCTSATLYCPNDPVTRLQMAAFLDRAGRALTPELFFIDLQPGPIDIHASADNYVCQSSPYAVVDYPRTAVIHTRFTGEVDAPVNWRSDIWYSTDNGMTWNFATNTIPSEYAPLAGESTQQTGFAFVHLNVGQTYVFANRIRLRNGAGNFTASRCHAMVEIRNRNGSAAPFDPAALAGAGPDQNAAQR